ncbi:SDR family oxidoreductase [Rhizobiales bacterium]|uniref:SDR family NAD(P)-dependent oxidoreductase n=1 Tax=Hongsoonwoonella zoysiae TaxID=2821844 RepID=UPI00155FB28B|nr:SDR family oxidoreductase [Hongsoonwoonella zoysiae]NRG17754.1 SDR family oxidoreductase [Hongsoonwoonella zoysiae]
MFEKALRFDGKNALVVGGSSGIGFEVAKEFALLGAEVTVLANDDLLDEAASAISRVSGRTPRQIFCDITDREDLRGALEPLGNVDILVHNAGFERLTPLLDDDRSVEESFRRIIDVNLMGAYYVTREIVARMPDGGRIIYTASTYSKYAISRMSGYASSKHGLVGMMRSFSQELGARRITVNAVCPGWVNTEFSNRSVRKIAEETGRSFEDVGNDVWSLQAIEGHLEARDIVGGYIFFASDLARDVSGQTLHVDRGEYQS